MDVDWSALESTQRLQREKGVRGAVNTLTVEDPGAAQRLEEHASVLLSHSKWEARDGGLMLVQEYTKWKVQHRLGFDAFPPWIDSCLQLLADKEIRIRTSVGETLALLCKVGGLKLYDEKVAGPLLSSIESSLTLERDGQALLDDDESTRLLAEKLLAGEAARQLKQTSSRASRASSMQSTIFHDTAGWGTLETDVTCLKRILERCGADMAPRMTADGEVLELLCTCAVHMNRFVREIAFNSLEAAIGSLHQADSAAEARGHEQGEPLLDAVSQASDLVTRLGSGLCDEWANVRMGASMALRSFLVSLETPQRRQRFFDVLLPRMCVNRYYVAVGVANYSRETWRLILADKGREAIVQWLPSIAPFYIMQTKLANSEAREAAAKCIGELAARIDAAVVSPYTTDLFRALVPRMGKADAWEVKESACTAIAEMVRAFPERFNLSSDFPELLPSLSATLANTVWSVRNAAAVALCALVNASEGAAANVVLALCLDGLTSASRELDEREKYGNNDLAKVKQQRENDVALHTNQDGVIDCCAVGDLDPDDSELLQMTGKLALSAIYNQAQKNKLDLRQNSWERTDGCLYLVRELSANGRWNRRGEDKAQLCIEDALEAMGRVASLRQFVKHLTLLTTLWTVLPKVANAIGAEAFQPYLGHFAESLSYTLSCSDGRDALAVEAAKACALELSRLLGREDFCTCVRRHDAASLDTFSDCLGPQ